MPIDVKGTLFWFAVVLALLIWMMRGCAGRMDKFREHRQERQQQWQEQREERKQQRDHWRESRDERGNWRDRRRKQQHDETPAAAIDATEGGGLDEW